ncbi:DctP family TRAP transporter solute-binding subunit [uncultured Dysosmobacter sp.]|uniref:DctP family TRAP transporter solute-binding subunit n=1 Tax=uncultured Dysosmobacter sp. TaxID=2591384 RepID=UPI0026098C92|nr:DctP family TRAP transporter solute-binding subunit [uncultured Dysosmobacter sp.]
MKKFLAMILAIAMTLSLAACGGKTTEKTEDPKTDTETKEPAQTGDEPVELTAIVAGLTEDSPSGVALKKFAELCNTYSDGSVTIDCFFNTELGNVSACVESTAQGTIDIVSTGTSYFAGYVPAIQVFELPYVFGSYDEAHQTLDGEAGKEIADLFDSTDLKMLCYWESGMRHVTNSRNPIITPDDMKGLKIRTVVSETQQATWEAFGAIPMALDMGEVFTALQNHTVDAQENTLSSITSYKMQEVQKYLSMTYHAYTPMPFFINRAKWDSLSENQQAAIQKASEEARDYARELNAAGEEECLQTLRDAGVEIEENPDTAAFAALCDPVYQIFNKAMGSDEYLTMVQEFVASLR